MAQTASALRVLGCPDQAVAIEAATQEIGPRASGGGPEVAVQLHWRNDDFGPTNLLRPEGNGDHGPTNTFGGRLTFTWGDSALTLDVKNNMFTEKKTAETMASLSSRSDHATLRRQDELPVVAGYSRTLQLSPPVELTLEGRAGFVLVGDLGGLAMQDGFHGAISRGARLGDGLAEDYMGEGFSGAGLIGGSMQLRVRLLPWIQIYAAPSTLAAIGSTGVSHVELDSGVRLQSGPGSIRVYLDGGLSLGHYLASDPRLTLPGAYGVDGAYVQPHLAVGLDTEEFGVGVQLNVNEANSGIDTGVLFFRIGSVPIERIGAPVR